MSKVNLKPAEDKSFKPFTLEITVESAAEAWGMWHRMNMSTQGLINGDVYKDEFLNKLERSDINQNAWYALHSEMERQGLIDD